MPWYDLLANTDGVQMFLNVYAGRHVLKENIVVFS